MLCTIPCLMIFRSQLFHSVYNYKLLGIWKVMEMEHELQELRLQIREKCIVSVKLQNEVWHFLPLPFCKYCWITILLQFCLVIIEISVSSFSFHHIYLRALQLQMSRKAEDNSNQLYELSGSQSLGSILRIQSCSNEEAELAKCSVQWYRLSSQSSRREPILGINSSFPF